MKSYMLLFAFGLSVFQLYAKKNNVIYQFNFGEGRVAKGFTPVQATQAYNKELGFGFDFGTNPTNVDSGNNRSRNCQGVSSTTPFYFSAKLGEGNYKVTVTLGNPNTETVTTIKAESRRLMIEHVATNVGKYITTSFIVNIKDRQIDADTKVSLKERENTKLDWDDKLTLEFDLNPTLTAITIEKLTNQVTVFLAGNSTVVNQEYEPWAAWGQMIPRFFKPGVAIANHAESGLTLGSFMGSKRLQKIMSIIKPGDYLFIEFGHNDQKEKGPNDGAWKSYTERMKQFISEAQSKGAIPVVVTSTARRNFDASGKNSNSLGDYPAAARKAAQDAGVALIDLNEMSTQFYEALGVELSKKALVHYPANTFPGQKEALADNTHFSPYGAYELAKCVIEGIKKNKLPLAKFLYPTPTFNPSQPDAFENFYWPPSPNVAILKPDGN